MSIQLYKTGGNSMRKKSVSEYFEWTPLSYRSLRWVLILVVLTAIGISYYIITRLPPSENSSTPGELQDKRTAEFLSIDGDVRVKQVNSLEWVEAEKIKQLSPGDYIKTNNNSSCRVAFFDGSIYEVKPETLLYIVESYQDRSTLRRSVNVAMADGAVDISTTDKPDTSKTKIETPNAVADVGPQTTAATAYDTKINGTNIKVSKGSATVQSKTSGQMVEAKPNEEVSVLKEQLTKKALPVPPLLLAPRESEIFTTNDPVSVRIRLEWQQDQPSYKYRVSVSSTPQFYQNLNETIVEGKNYLPISGLEFGNYYWRVVAIDQGVEGYPSSTGMFGIRPKRINPPESIVFDIKQIVIIGDILEVIGSTAPDNYVRINGKRVILNKDGSFKHFTDPFTGSSVARLKIEITDYSGSVREIIRTVKLE